MSLRIVPQECQISRDMPTIRTRVPVQDLDDGVMVAQAVKFMRLSPGDHVLVQSMNHERTELLHEAVFVVRKMTVSMKKVTKDDLSEQSVEVSEYEVARKGDWWSATAESKTQAENEPGDSDKEEEPQKRKPGRPARAAA